MARPAAMWAALRLGPFDGFGRTVDAGDPSRREPVAHQGEGDTRPAAELEDAVVGRDVEQFGDHECRVDAGMG